MKYLLLLLSSTAFAGSPMLWNDGDFGNLITQRGFYFNAVQSLEVCSADPTAGLARTTGSACFRDAAGVGQFWIKKSSTSTDWDNIVSRVTSVGLTAPSIFTVSGSPVTGSGTLDFSLNSQNANRVFAGPSSGGAATPTFRALVSGDIPDLSSVYANITLSNLGTTSINASLLPNGSLDIGSLALPWSNVYSGSLWADSLVENDGTTAFDIVNRYIKNNAVAARNVFMASDANAGYYLLDASTVTDASNISLDFKNRKLQSGATVKLDWSGTDVSLNTRKLTNVTDPSAAQDAATKNYVDTRSIPRSQIAAGSLSHIVVNDASTGLLSSIATLNEARGGTNQTTYATGDILYASAANTLSKRSIGSTGDVLTVSGGLPVWTASTIPISTQGTRQTGLSMSAATSISATSSRANTVFVVGNGGAVVITASPPVGTSSIDVGTTMDICGTSDTNTVQYDNSVNLVLNGSIVLGKDDCLSIKYMGTDGTNLSWVETGRNN